MQLKDRLQNKSIKLNEKTIKMYVCGPTVYGDVHIGNLRPVVIFDVLQRLLLETNKNFFYVQNITDIDDKIIFQASIENISEEELATKYTKRYFDVLKKANILSPSLFVKVSDNINDIIYYVKNLIANDAAYVCNGDVYFDTNKFLSQYGKLAKQNLNELQESARCLIEDNKKNPHDFVLWKQTDFGKKWQAPWSHGRPGWHTECALFIDKYLGTPITIHGGGIDLIFPHHENERIQLLALNHDEPVKIWLHNGHLFSNELKMSKSLKNTILAKDFLEQYHSNILRYMLVTSHYSKPLNINEELIEQAKSQIGYIYQTLKNCLVQAFLNNEQPHKNFKSNFYDQFIEQLENDLNFNQSWIIILDLVKRINKILKKNHSESLVWFNTVEKLLEILGINFQWTQFNDINKKILHEWQKARNEKKYELSDKLRKQLQEQNIF